MYVMYTVTCVIVICKASQNDMVAKDIVELGSCEVLSCLRPKKKKRV